MGEKRIGRPPLGDKALIYQANVKFNREQLAYLEHLCAETGLTRSECLRVLVIGQMHWPRLWQAFRLSREFVQKVYGSEMWGLLDQKTQLWVVEADERLEVELDLFRIGFTNGESIDYYVSTLREVARRLGVELTTHVETAEAWRRRNKFVSVPGVEAHD